MGNVVKSLTEIQMYYIDSNPNLLNYSYWPKLLNYWSSSTRLVSREGRFVPAWAGQHRGLEKVVGGQDGGSPGDGSGPGGEWDQLWQCRLDPSP